MQLEAYPVHHRHVSGETPQQLLPLVGSGHSQILRTNPGPSLYYCHDRACQKTLTSGHSLISHLQSNQHCAWLVKPRGASLYNGKGLCKLSNSEVRAQGESWSAVAMRGTHWRMKTRLRMRRGAYREHHEETNFCLGSDSEPARERCPWARYTSDGLLLEKFSFTKASSTRLLSCIRQAMGDHPKSHIPVLTQGQFS